jgi:probable phosphoglycerate mutase
MTRFIVVRHGETLWNLAGRVQGHGDSELSAAGRAQAEALARRLAGEPFDVLVSSDLGRAMATARTVARLTGHEVLADPRVRERGFGSGEGLGYAEIEARYPGGFRPSGVPDPDYAIPGGESRRAFQDRVATAFEALALEHAGRRVLVITHGGVVGALYRHIHGIAPDTAHRIAIANASYNEVAREGEAWTIGAWGDCAHLDGAGAEEV